MFIIILFISLTLYEINYNYCIGVYFVVEIEDNPLIPLNSLIQPGKNFGRSFANRVI